MGIDFFGAKLFMMDPRLSVELVLAEKVTLLLNIVKNIFWKFDILGNICNKYWRLDANKNYEFCSINLIKRS